METHLCSTKILSPNENPEKFYLFMNSKRFSLPILDIAFNDPSPVFTQYQCNQWQVALNPYLTSLPLFCGEALDFGQFYTLCTATVCSFVLLQCHSIDVLFSRLYSCQGAVRAFPISKSQKYSNSGRNPLVFQSFGLKKMHYFLKGQLNRVS